MVLRWWLGSNFYQKPQDRKFSAYSQYSEDNIEQQLKVWTLGSN